MSTKICPHCESEIQAEAKKCRYCKEWLNTDEMKDSKTKEDGEGLPEKISQNQQKNETINTEQESNKKKKEGELISSFYQKESHDNASSSNFVSKKIFYIAFMVVIFVLILSWGIFLNFKNTLTKELSDKVSIKEFYISIEGSDMKLSDNGMKRNISWGKSDKHFTKLHTYLAGYRKCRFVGSNNFSHNGITIGILGNREKGGVTYSDKSDEFYAGIFEDNDISFYKIQNNRVDTWSALSDYEIRNFYFHANILCIK